MIPRLKELYKTQIQSDLKNQFGLKNLLMVPRIEKVVLKSEEIQSAPIKFLHPIITALLFLTFIFAPIRASSGTAIKRFENIVSSI